MPAPSRFPRLASFVGAFLAVGVGIVTLATAPAHAIEADSTATLNGVIPATAPLIELTGDFTLTADITDINYPVTIDGNGHTISAAGSDSFDIKAQAHRVS